MYVCNVNVCMYVCIFFNNCRGFVWFYHVTLVITLVITMFYHIIHDPQLQPQVTTCYDFPRQRIWSPPPFVKPSSGRSSNHQAGCSGALLKALGSGWLVA